MSNPREKLIRDHDRLKPFFDEMTSDLDDPRDPFYAVVPGDKIGDYNDSAIFFNGTSLELLTEAEVNSDDVPAGKTLSALLEWCCMDDRSYQELHDAGLVAVFCRGYQPVAVSRLM